MDKTVDLKVKAAGDGNTNNSPSELARILFILGVGVALSLAYVVKSCHS